MSAEDSIALSNTEFETNQENAIERMRTLVKEYAGLLAADEKKNLLSENGLTEKDLETFRTFSDLNWKMAGKHQLPLSNSTISIPSGYALITGSDAVALHTMDGEPIDKFLEAYVFDNNDLDNSIVFQNMNIGYVSIDDWKEINPKELLKQIIKNTEEDNKERRKRGLTELHVIGWIQEPVLDRHTNTVYWAIEANSGSEDNFINSIAIRLGREGYETITWVTSRSSYVPFGDGHLGTMLRAHSFDPGYRYTDYKTGDKLAGYGIAALVAGTVGGKIAKASGILLLLKKFGTLLFAGIAAVFYKLKSLFARNKAIS